MEYDRVLCSNPECWYVFDPIGEKNHCPFCDLFLGGESCKGCEFLVEEEQGELTSGKILKSFTCGYNGLCPYYGL